MLLWLSELTVASFLLAYAAERRNYSSRDRHSHLCCSRRLLRYCNRGRPWEQPSDDDTRPLTNASYSHDPSVKSAAQRCGRCHIQARQDIPARNCGHKCSSVHRRLQFYRWLYLCGHVWSLPCNGLNGDES